MTVVVCGEIFSSLHCYDYESFIFCIKDSLDICPNISLVSPISKSYISINASDGELQEP
jgi:hypothetical protein